MAVVNGGTVGLQNGINSIFGRGTSTANYRGTGYWYAVPYPASPGYTYGANSTFASSNLSLEQFYGKAPTDEFENPPVADCAYANCGK
jgi:hypothetical protein